MQLVNELFPMEVRPSGRVMEVNNGQFEKLFIVFNVEGKVIEVRESHITKPSREVTPSGISIEVRELHP